MLILSSARNHRVYQGPEGCFRGIFAIPPTPFDETDNIDEASLRRCIDFCIAAGVHGIVGPVNASEAVTLTDEERLRVTEIIVEQTAKRVPVIIGVSGTSTAASMVYTRHAAEVGADAVMAMPPYLRDPAEDEILDFYSRIAQASGDRPVWIQNYVAPIGTPMTVALVARLLKELPGVDFLKEETLLAPQVMTSVREAAGNALRGVMGGMGGWFLPEEYRRGACGTMPACEVADIHVVIWDALEQGKHDVARELHTQLLPLLNYEAMYSFAIYKEVLVRRGVITSSRTRIPGTPKLDAENNRELNRILRDLAPLMTSRFQG